MSETFSKVRPNARRALARRALFVSAVTGAAGAWAQSGHGGGTSAATSPECQNAEPTLSRTTNMGNKPLDYFISAAGDTAYYISRHANYAQRLGQTTGVRVPGGVDPVPTPDGKFLTTPSPIAFYSGAKVAEALASGGSAENLQPMKTDSALQGVYQSIGIARRDSSGPVYRVITDRDGATFRDYAYDAASDRIVPQGEGAHVVCDRLQKSNRQLPMISKDGRLASFYDSETRSTKIYDIGSDGLGCNLVADLGFPTGKVDFDFNNDRIAFHLDFNRFQKSYFSGVDTDMAKDVFVAKLRKSSSGAVTGIDSIARLSTSERLGSGTYYPRWTNGGKIVASRDEDNHFSLAEFEPQRANYVPFWSPSQPDSASVADHARYALGGLRALVCTGQGVVPGKADEQAWFALSLSRDACLNLVRTHWERRKSEIREQLRAVSGLVATVLFELKQSDLEAACPRSALAAAAPVQNVGHSARSSVSVEGVFAAKCQECHNGGHEDPVTGHVAPALDLANMTLDQVRAARRMINSRSPRTRMPPADAGQLDAEEKRLLLERLDQIEADLTR